MDGYNFSNILRELLASRGVSQKWLADEAKTTEATISRYIAGKVEPNTDTIVGIAQAFRVSVDYLCGLTDTPIPRESLGKAASSSLSYIAFRDDAQIDELHLLMRCYDRADDRDKKTIWTILERYMTDKENVRINA